VQEERRIAAWIGASVVITGDVTSSEDMTIAGQVEGDVAVPENDLVIEREARIQGDVVARSVVVRGRVNGSITAERRLEIGESGTVEGDMRAPRIVVSEGAVLHGRLERLGGPSGRGGAERPPETGNKTETGTG
jgi:cytoskeletal protein CcmA (bactofilin family)